MPVCGVPFARAIPSTMPAAFGCWDSSKFSATSIGLDVSS